MSSKLSSLFVDEKEVDKELIAEILDPYLRIGKESGDIIPNENFNKATIRKKIILYCLGKKIAKLNGIIQDEYIKPDTLAAQINEPLKTVREITSQLKKKRLLDKDKSGYFIANANLINIKAALESGHEIHKKPRNRNKDKR